MTCTVTFDDVSILVTVGTVGLAQKYYFYTYSSRFYMSDIFLMHAPSCYSWPWLKNLFCHIHHTCTTMAAAVAPPPSKTIGEGFAAPAPAAKKKVGGYDVPWVERYRPETLDEVVGNEETLVRLRAIANDGNMPNLILSGPPGTGKTTSVHALARQLLGSAYSTGVLELNASDARGIDIVRNKIKGFAQNKVNLPPGRHKIIILDEADSMTSAAQQALRRTMEIFSHTTRFALACNVSTKIIEPIQSRAAILRYSRLSDEQILARLKFVCTAEEVSYTDDGLEAIVFTAEGDMRNALNNLQATHSGFGHINQTNVFKVCDQPHPTTVRGIIDDCIEGKTGSAVQKMQALYATGYSCNDIIGTLFKVCKAHDMPEALKLEYLREIGFAHMKIADGVNSLLQLLGLVSRLCQKVEVA